MFLLEKNEVDKGARSRYSRSDLRSQQIIRDGDYLTVVPLSLDSQRFVRHSGSWSKLISSKSKLNVAAREFQIAFLIV